MCSKQLNFDQTVNTINQILSKNQNEHESQDALDELNKARNYTLQAQMRPLTNPNGGIPYYSGVDIKTQEGQRPLTDPSMQSALMKYLNSPGGGAEKLGNIFKIGEMGQPEHILHNAPGVGVMDITKNPNGTYSNPTNIAPEPDMQNTQIVQQADGSYAIINKKTNEVKYPGIMGKLPSKTPFDIWREQNKDVPVSKFFETQNKGKANSTGWKQVKNEAGDIIGLYNPVTNETKSPANFGLENFGYGQTTSTTRTMQETSPKVLALAQKIVDKLPKLNDELGPTAGRWEKFWTTGVGTSNPEYAKLRTDVGLLSTLLMRMHVGARGSKEIMEKFDNLIGLGNQSSENMMAAMQEIISYANDVKAHAHQSIGKKTMDKKPTSGKYTIEEVK